MLKIPKYNQHLERIQETAQKECTKLMVGAAECNVKNQTNHDSG